MDLTDNVIEEVQKKEGLIASFLDTLPEKALNLGIRIGLALVFFFIGMQLIRLIRKIIRKSMNRAGAEIGVIQFVDYRGVSHKRRRPCKDSLCDDA